VSVSERVAGIVGPLVAARQLSLYDLEMRGSILAVVVDREGGVDLDTISDLTRDVSRALDADDPMPGHYTLEVSSPGLERPLRRRAHFARAVGQHIKVKTKPHVEGDRRLEGVLATAGDDGIELLDDDGTTRALAYDDIERANTIFVWGPTPKPGKKSGKATVTKKAVHA
jgi:ribosome maturation factor RimP